MTAGKIAALRKMPLNEKFKVLNCRTGNYLLFQPFHLRHCAPASTDRIISKNSTSFRLERSLKVLFFRVPIPFTSFLLRIRPGTIRLLNERKKYRLKVKRMLTGTQASEQIMIK